MMRHVLQATIVTTVIATAFCNINLFVARSRADENKDAQSAAKQSREKNPLRDTSALDAELLKDLGGAPRDDEAKSTPLPEQRNRLRDVKTKRDASAKQGGDGTVERELLKGVDEGEDIGEPSTQNPLTRLSREMRAVEARIGQQRSDESTRELQDQVVRHLEELIKSVRPSSPRGDPSPGSDGAGKGGQAGSKRRSASQPRQRATGSQAADNPAQQSSQRTRDQQAIKPDPADLRELLKGVWGQLPERQREQMIQSYEEQFLPKYEQMISDYFRSIADDPERKR